MLPFLTRENLTLRSRCEGLPEYVCKSRGLSRSFSKILRLDVEGALKHNPYAIRIFLFFAFQLAFRIIFSFAYRRFGDRIITADIVLSAIYFLMAFYPLVLP
jgi:hypothetical protein